MNEKQKSARLPLRALGTAMLMLGVAVGSSHSAHSETAPPRYLITDLGTLNDSQDNTFASGLNAVGQAVGTGRTSTASRPQIAYRWDRGEMVNLGTLPGSTFSRAFTLNNAGFAVGEAFTSPAAGELSRAILWAPDGTLTDIDGFVAGGVAYGINNSNVVVGASTQTTDAGNTVRAFRWEAGTFQDLGTLSTVVNASSRGLRINDQGHVVGSSQTDFLHEGARASHAFLWRDGVMTDLGSLSDDPGDYSIAYELNEADQVVGEGVVGEVPSSSGTLSVQHGFLWNNGVMTDLGTLGTLRHSRANDINNRGQIVGHSTQIVGAPANGRAVLWENGRINDLNDLVTPNNRWVLQTAESINDRGEIIGYGTFVGQTRAFLLTPNDPGPSNLTATPVSTSQVNLTWADTTAVEEGWIVERRTQNGAFALIASLGVNATSYSDTGLAEDMAYVYRVRATSIAGDLQNSNEATAATQAEVAGGSLKVGRQVLFGKVRREQSRTRTLVLRNQSRTEALRVTVGTAAAPFSVVSGAGTFVVEPRTSHTVTLAFTPTTRGAVLGTLAIESSDPRHATASVKLVGAGR